MGGYERELHEMGMTALNNDAKKKTYPERIGRIRQLCAEINEDINQPFIQDREILSRFSEIIRLCFDPERCTELHEIDPDAHAMLMDFRCLPEPIEVSFRQYLDQLQPSIFKLYPGYFIQPDDFFQVLLTILSNSKFSQFYSGFVGDYNVLHLAAIKNSHDLIALCHRHGMDLNQPCRKGLSALHLAIVAKSDQALMELIKLGADVNRTDPAGHTPLHLIAMSGNIETLGLFLDHGAEVNVQNNQGNTPLHLAVIYRQFNVVQLLLEAPVFLDLPNQANQTAPELWRRTRFIPPEFQDLFK